ncbi:LuxR family transcriptional regulator [Leifsonia sp. ku-ls]|nr:LuxR family transcriptional regulator [Leifsonia sp. ku-ls]
MAAPDQSTDGRATLDALKVAVEAADWAAANAAVRSGWFELMSLHGEATRVLLEQAPVSTLRAQPLLAMMLGVTYNAIGFHRMRALRYFVIAVRAARTPRNLTLDSVDRALIRAAESSAYRLLGRPTLAVGPATAAVAALDQLTDEQRAEIAQLPRLYSQAGISLYYAGEVEKAMDTFAKGLAASPTTPPSPGFGNLAMLAGIHAMRGDLPEALEHVEYARTGPWNARQRSMYTGTFYRLAEAMLALERFDTPAAQEHLTALDHDRRTIEHWLAEAQVEAMLLLVEGRPGDALAGLEAYVAMRGAEGRSSVARHALSRLRSLLQLALGNPDAASVIVERDTPPGPVRRIERARVNLSLGKNGSALTELKAAAGHPLDTRTTAEAAALETAVLLRFPTTARTRGVVQQLGALLARTTLRLPLAFLPSDDLERVAAALQAAGYGGVTTDVPLRSLLPTAEPELLLSERELAVLAQLMETGSVAEIASALVVSANTVKTQLRGVYRKLGVNNREDAIAVAVARHLLVERD